MYRGLIYGLGLLIQAVGITLNTKTGLGVSPIVCVPFAASEIWGWSIGDTTFAAYALFLLLQAVLLGRNFRLWALLQLPLSLVFTRFLNLFSGWIPVQTQPLWQWTALGAAVVLTGVGAAMTLDMRLIPNPGDGAVQAISDFTGKEMGLCKNYFDGANVAAALILSLAAAGKILGIGIGTLAAIFGIGRVIAAFNRRFLGKLQSLAGI